MINNKISTIGEKGDILIQKLKASSNAYLLILSTAERKTTQQMAIIKQTRKILQCCENAHNKTNAVNCL